MKKFFLICFILLSNISWSSTLEERLVIIEKNKHVADLQKLKQIAALGDVSAQYSLGLIYFIGQDVAQNYTEAIKWFRLAATQGDQVSQYSLGIMYLEGLGVLQNFIKAHMWFNLAAASGNNKYINARNQITKLMTPQQVAEAQELASKCLASNYKDCN